MNFDQPTAPPRRGPGRPRGSKSKRTQAVQELVASKGVSPVEALAELTQWHLERWREAAARVERAEDADAEERSRLIAEAIRLSGECAAYADKLAPFVAPKLSAVQASFASGAPVRVQIVRQGDAG